MPMIAQASTCNRAAMHIHSYRPERGEVAVSDERAKEEEAGGPTP